MSGDIGEFFGIIGAAIIAIVIVIGGFFWFLPEFSKAIGYSIFPSSIFGFLLLLAIIVSAVVAIVSFFRR